MSTLTIQAETRATERLWPVAIPLAAGLALWAAIFHAEIVAAVAVWWQSTAYGHCFLVLPIAAYLAWTRRAAVAVEPLQPMPWAAVGGIPLAAGWLAANRLGVMEAGQFAALGFLELLFLSALGWRICRALAVPMLYLLFLVPFGAFLTPALQDFTARFIAVGLDVLGIPHFADAVTIEIPQGTFYVAEACAGLRFLIGSAAFGVLYACLLYRSPVRRAGFILAAMLVPILGNGLRGLGIVVLGYLLGSAQAATTDHLLYGWVFFSLLILLLTLAGLPWREDGAGSVPPARRIAAAAQPKQPAPAFWATAALAVPVVMGPAAAALLDRDTAVLAFPPAFPALAAPTDCVAAGQPTAANAGQSLQRFRCNGLLLDVVLDIFPPRVNPAAVLAAERQATGVFGALEVTQAQLAVADGGPRWRLVETARPDQVTASAIWIDGQSGSGGLAERARQGWNSVVGGRYAPIVMALQVRGTDGGGLDPRQRGQARDLLRRALAGEPMLAERIGRFSREAAVAAD